MADDAPNPRIFEGANNPPAAEADPYAAIKLHCDDLYERAGPWLTGAPITTDAQAIEVEQLLADAKEAAAAADAQRIVEAKPHDDAKAAVQAKFAPLIADNKAQTGTMVRLEKACKALLTPWRTKKQQEAAAAAAAAQAEADRIAKAAADAARAASGDLEATENAEDALRAAQQAQRDANRATKAATTGTGLTTYHEAVMTDQKAAILFYMKSQPAEFVALAQRLADVDVRNGKRKIDGFTVEERKRAR